MSMKGLEPVKQYIFLFINPLSGDQKGKDLTELKIQHFRLKELPSTQVQIYSIIDKDKKQRGIDYLKSLLQERRDIQLKKEEQTSNYEIVPYELHVWSGGGDGTIIGILDDLIDEGIDINEIIFSCLPFGTGNDFSQALGWGKTMPDDVLGDKLSILSNLITKRLKDKTSNKVTLDIWNAEIKVEENNGYIKKVVKKGKESEKMKRFDRNFCVYFALGVQGFVGSGFERRRTNSRFYNFFVYFFESLKWVAFRKFPSITNILKSISSNGKQICYSKNDNKDNSNNNQLPIINEDMIEIIVQNIPRVWSMDIDLWKDAENLNEDNSTSISNISDNSPINKKNWSEQLSNDGKIEIMGIKSMRHYLKLVSNKTNDTVLRIGQFKDEVELQFHDPSNPNMPKRNRFRQFFRSDVFKNTEDSWMSYCMIDGEFYQIYKPTAIRFKPFIKLNIIGSTFDESRVVRDELS